MQRRHLPENATNIWQAKCKGLEINKKICLTAVYLIAIALEDHHFLFIGGLMVSTGTKTSHYTTSDSILICKGFLKYCILLIWRAHTVCGARRKILILVGDFGALLPANTTRWVIDNAQVLWQETFGRSEALVTIR